MPSTTNEGGWGLPHKTERKKWEALFDAGAEHDCAKCGRRVYATDNWQLGHTYDRKGWTGPEHAHCNLSDGAQRRHEPMIIRTW